MSDMLNEWLKQTHGSYEKMYENENNFIKQTDDDAKARLQYVQEISAKPKVSLAEHLGYKALDLKPKVEGQKSYFKNYDFSREKTLRSFKRSDDGIEMGDMGSSDV